MDLRALAPKHLGNKVFLFHSMEDSTKTFDKTNFNKQSNRPCKVASKKLRKYVPTHSFRATIITDLLKKGVPIRKVKDLMGHKTIANTQMYRIKN